MPLGAILKAVIRRIIALVVALALVSAAAATELCQIRCDVAGNSSVLHLHGQPSRDQQAGAHHAACHEEGDAPQRVSPLGDGCQHPAESTPSVVAARTSSPVMSLLATLVSVQAIEVEPAHSRVSARASARQTSLAIPLSLPLRV